ncbi:CBS domain-containing protein [Alicyclobacillus kakegawensis]|uniref:CBS domain-containing protein n=1 Tax=Alicyclobacillus kakegawensis TaxID=392012 RepID=UPI0008357C26|nr:CBS domain-containing protein [Alicyclobacillus kakegawensis]
MKVRDLMTANVSYVQESDPVQKAAQIMNSVNCGSVPVCDANKRVVGIITDRDIACKAVANGQFNAQVRDCMSRQVITATPDTDAHEAADLMAQHQIRRLPVCDSAGTLQGICAIGDLARQNIHINEAGDALSRISQPTQAQSQLQ